MDFLPYGASIDLWWESTTKRRKLVARSITPTMNDNQIQIEIMIRALEIIAVGDAKDPIACAKEALIEIGFWLDNQASRD